MFRFKFAAIALASFFAAASLAHAESFDFTTLPIGTAVTNQYSGVAFSLAGGPDSSGSPTIGGWEGPIFGLTNSNSGNYPTANILDISFATPVDNLSFTINNWGSGNGTFFTAYDGATIVATGDISNLAMLEYDLVNVSGSGITDLKINNNTGGESSWIFAVGSLSFTPETSETPEPGTLLLLGTGLTGMAGLLRRRSRAQ